MKSGMLSTPYLATKFFLEAQKALKERFIGQASVIDNLLQAIYGITTNKNPYNIPFIAFTGPCGSGKSLILREIAKELGMEILTQRYVSCSPLDKTIRNTGNSLVFTLLNIEGSEHGVNKNFSLHDLIQQYQDNIKKFKNTIFFFSFTIKNNDLKYEGLVGTMPTHISIEVPKKEDVWKIFERELSAKKMSLDKEAFDYIYHYIKEKGLGLHPLSQIINHMDMNRGGNMFSLEYEEKLFTKKEIEELFPIDRNLPSLHV